MAKTEKVGEMIDIVFTEVPVCKRQCHTFQVWHCLQFITADINPESDPMAQHFFQIRYIQYSD